MKKIICPTDFSDSADNAIAFAAKIAQKSSATLTLFHVEALLEQTVGDFFMGEEYNVLEASVRLNEQSAQVRKAFRISCEAEVISSARSPIAVIAEESGGYDLMVMGSSGPHTRMEWLIGSHTFRTAIQMEKPLLLVSEICSYSEITKTVFAYDYLSHSNLPLQQVLDFTKSLGSELTVLQVMKDPYTREAEMKLESIQKKVKESYPDEKILFNTIYSSDLISSLDAYIERNEIDVLALCTDDYGFIEGLFHKSTIKAMSVLADYPVLITHR